MYVAVDGPGPGPVPDSTRVDVSGRWAAIVRHWRAEQTVPTLRGHRFMERSASFSPDGQFIITASDDGTARLWDWAAGSAGLIVAQATVEIPSIAYAPDANTFAIGNADGLVSVHDCEVCLPIDELVPYAQERLTRELTPEERVRYLGETTE